MAVAFAGSPERELAVLAALRANNTWHSPGWLRSRSLIPPDMGDSEFCARADTLAEAGEAVRRHSPAKGPMYRITASGKLRLIYDTTRRQS